MSSATVQPLPWAACRACARPGCRAPASATLQLRYALREAAIGALTAEASPATYDLCSVHADRTTAPRGWDLRDTRGGQQASAEGVVKPAPDTVAVLAAALRAVPSDPPSPTPPASGSRQLVLEGAPSPVLEPPSRPVPASAPTHGSATARERPAAEW